MPGTWLNTIEILISIQLYAYDALFSHNSRMWPTNDQRSTNQQCHDTVYHNAPLAIVSKAHKITHFQKCLSIFHFAENNQVVIQKKTDIL